MLCMYAVILNMMTCINKLLPTYKPVQQGSEDQQVLRNESNLEAGGKSNQIHGSVLQQGEAQAQCYNAENILVSTSSSHPWIAEAPDPNDPNATQNNWFVLDLMGTHTIDSITFATIGYDPTNCLQSTTLRGADLSVGNGWIDGEVTIEGKNKMEDDEWVLLLPSIAAPAAQNITTNIPSSTARNFQVSFIKVSAACMPAIVSCMYRS